MSRRPTALLSQRAVLLAAMTAAGISPLFATPAMAAGGIPDGTELVSKAGGRGGLPFPARLGEASQNGRFVLLRPRIAGPADPAQPETSIPSESGIVIRDRQADTTVPLEFSGSIQIRSANGISDDGDRLIVGTVPTADASADATVA